MHRPNIARISFEEGSLEVENGEIRTEWRKSLSAEDKSWLTDGWGRVLAGLQEGHLVLHGSGAVVGGFGCVTVGYSGAGKSTTLVALRNHGNTPLVDEVCILDGQGLRQPQPELLIRPFKRSISITKSTIGLLDLPGEDWRELSTNPSKGLIPGPDASTLPIALDVMFELVKSDQVDAPRAHELSNMDALSVLLLHSHYQGFSREILGDDAYLKMLSALVSKVPVIRIERPTAKNSVSEVVDLIESLVVTYCGRANVADAESLRVAGSQT
jgi:hypothetical protein